MVSVEVNAHVWSINLHRRTGYTVEKGSVGLSPEESNSRACFLHLQGERRNLNKE